MTLYLVSHGCYSSYGILAVYDDRALAEAYIGHPHPKDGGCKEPRCEYDIEEYELNPHADDIRAGLKRHIVTMDRAGTVLRHESFFGRDLYGEPDRVVDWGERHVFCSQLLATSDEQAIKAANERRAAWIAANKPWPADKRPAPPPQPPLIFNAGTTLVFNWKALKEQQQ